MPWATLIIGAAFTGGAFLMVNATVTGTSSTDAMVRQIVPISILAIFALIIVFGLFGRH